jgi:WD40 repeat protein
MDTNGNNLKTLISATKEKSFFNPQYSPDGKQFLFIGYKKGSSTNGAIYIANSDGTGIKQLTAGNEIITTATFSKCGNTIIYIKANEYKKYSSLSQEQAHDMDIYTIRISDRKIKKITDLKAYGLYQVSEFDCENLLVYIAGGKEAGIFMLRNDSSKTVEQIIPRNDPREDPSLYSYPIYSPKFSILAFLAPYEIYTMNMQSLKAELLYDNKGHSNIGGLSFFNTRKRVLFTKEDGTLSFYCINLDGSGYTEIPLPSRQ